MWPLHPERPKPIHLIALGIFIVLLGVFAFVFTAAKDAVPGL